MDAKAGVLAGLTGSAALLAYAVRGRSSSLLAPSVYRGSKVRRSVALTFDDGPSESTPELLEILSKQNVSATFFVCGANVRRLPQIAREAVAAGHEIGNHTEHHQALYLKPRPVVYRELAGAQHSILEATGVRPRLFRAPFGARWFALREAQHRLGLLGVMWTAIALDWKLPADRIARRLLSDLRNGAIWCLHDGRELRSNPDIAETLAAVCRLIPILKDQGFQFETVSEILCPTM